MPLKYVRANGTLVDDRTETTVVGTWPVLDDNSDTTYVETDGTSTLEYTVGLEALTGYVEGDPITLHFRVSHAGEGTARAIMFLATGSGMSATLIAGFGGWDTPIGIPLTDGTPQTLTGALVPAPGYTEADAVAALEAGTAHLYVDSISSSDWEVFPPTARLYEAWLEVGTVSPCYKSLGVTFASDSIPPETVVGSAATVWRDSSDATYVTLNAEPDVTDVRAPIDPYTGPTVLDIGFTLRASTTGTPSGSTFIEIYTDSGTIANTYGLPLTGDGVIRDYSYTFSADEFAVPLADMKTMLADGSGILDIQAIGDYPINLYEVSIRVGHKCYVLAPPLRRYPPVNNGGFGPTRHHPRTVNRRVGGSY